MAYGKTRKPVLACAMPNQFHHAEDVLARLTAWQAEGQSCALAVVTDVAGGSMRGPGALMAIAQSCAAAGYISNGCVDGDIIARGVQCIRSGASAALRYGEGSPFKDITLPCGGSIDILIVPMPNAAIITAWSAALTARESVTVYMSETAGITLTEQPGFSHLYQPKLRLNVAGRGPAMVALARQACASGFDVRAMSPDDDDLRNITGVEARLLTPGGAAFEPADAWTATVLMFHDHDHEPAMLTAALDSQAFFIGAMGSRKTQAERLARLHAQGVNENQLARIHGPVGLVPSLRDANLVAVSTLAHIIQAAQNACKL